MQSSPAELSDDAYGALPLWLDVGYWLTPRVQLGGYATVGFVFPKRAERTDPLGGGCPEGVDCFAVGVRAGLQVHYYLLPRGRLNPWLGLGLGVEWVTADLEGEVLSVPIELSTQHAGVEWLHLQGGVDATYWGPVSLGAFFSASAMQYGWCASSLGGDTTDCEILESDWHGWLTLGARVGWDL